MVHVCEPKRRHMSKNEKHVIAAMMAFQKFYEIAQRSNKKKTFDEFVESPYYNAFVKFGSLFQMPILSIRNDLLSGLLRVALS